MEWGNAKKFVIVLLILLNVALAGLNYKQHEKNTMTATQERAIFEVLSQNGITMYTNLLTNPAPVSRLSVEIPEYSKETLERLFFGGEKTVVSMREDHTIYRGETKSLMIQGAHGVWENTEIGLGKENLTKPEAMQTAEKFIIGTEYFFGTYEEPVAVEKENGFEVKFYGTYKRENIFANYFSIFVTQDGIRKITFTYYPIQGYSGEKKDLCYSDEALYTFMREWKREGKSEATIYRMELGYDQMERSENANGRAVHLEPCYRIHLMDEEEPYLINAYTCQIMKKD